MVCKVSRATWVRPVRWVSKVFLAFPDPSAPWVSKVLSVRRGSLDLSVCVANRESLVRQACVDLLVLLALLVLSVFVARLVLSVCKASKVPTE